jgi:hypothetical protein
LALRVACSIYWLLATHTENETKQEYLLLLVSYNFNFVYLPTVPAQETHKNSSCGLKNRGEKNYGGGRGETVTHRMTKKLSKRIHFSAIPLYMQ